jgi:hypothetical protein
MSHVHSLGPPPFPLSPPVLAELRYEAELYRDTHDGLLPHDRDWTYLEHRWELDPSRFDHWHPLIGHWIAEDERLTHETMPLPYPPVPIVCEPYRPPPGESVGALAEPASVVSMFMGLVFAWIIFKGADW